MNKNHPLLIFVDSLGHIAGVMPWYMLPLLLPISLGMFGLLCLAGLLDLWALIYDYRSSK